MAGFAAAGATNGPLPWTTRRESGRTYIRFEIPLIEIGSVVVVSGR
jgi:hypothetical protein